MQPPNIYRRGACAARGLALSVPFALVSACAEGQLAQAELAAPCAPDDAACAAAGPAAPLAVGARQAFAITPTAIGGVSVAAALRSADARIVTVDDGELIAQAPGVVAVLAVADDGSVIDFTHPSVVAADRLTLHRSHSSGAVDARALPDRIEVFPGEDVTLTLHLWRGAQALAGDARETWSVDDAAFAVVDQGFAQERRIRAPASGTATLTVAALGLTHPLTLAVVP